HGLVEYFGPRGLDDALDTCAPLAAPGLLGCPQGAFMEYANASATTPGLLDRDKPLEPCASVLERDRPACWFEQPYWWRRTFGDEPAKFGAWCDGLPDADKAACLMGVGRSAAELSGYDARSVASDCDALAQDDGVSCRAGAWWLFRVLKKDDGGTCDELGVEF